MNGNKNKPVINVANKNQMTSDEINEFFGFDGSDDDIDSDWDELNEKDVNDFLHVNEGEKENVELIKPALAVIKPPVKLNTDKPLTISGYSDQRKVSKTGEQGVNETGKVKQSKYFIATPTRIRVSNCQTTVEEWKERIEGRQVMSVSWLYSRHDKLKNDKNADWVLVGVIGQTATKKDKNGRNFCVWQMTDLDGDTSNSVVKVLLFRDVYESFWKENVGTVVAILQPQQLSNSTASTYKEKAYVVENSLQVMVLGISPDYAVCQGKSKNGDPCRSVVNKSVCSWCSYHVQQGYFQATNRPGFVNIGMERLNERKRKAINPDQSWILDKKPRTSECSKSSNGVSVPKTQLSLKKLQQTGVATLARNWLGMQEHEKDLIDRQKISDEQLKQDECGLIASIPDKDKTSASVIETGVSIISTVVEPKMTENETKFSNLLKRPSAGSLNFMKHILRQSTEDGSSHKISNGTGTGNKVGRRSGNETDINRNRSTLTNNHTGSEHITFNQLRQNYKPKDPVTLIPKRDNPQHYIDLGMKPVKLDSVSSEVYRAELNKLRYAAQVQEQGGHAAAMAAKRIERLKNVSSTLTKDNLKGVEGMAAQKSSGLSSTMMELLKQGSSNKSLVETQKYLELDSKLERIEKIDQMEQVLSAQHEQECVLFICEKCQTRTPMRPKMCVAEGHQVKTVKGVKRFFRCIKCKQRIVTYDKYPNESCAKCGACVFEKTGKLKEKEVAGEKLHVHGTEKRFISN